MSRGPALVVLAAGASTRLGSCKALVRLGPGAADTPLARLLAAGTPACEGPPLVVAGHEHAALAAALPATVELVRNPRPEDGRSGSLQVAARQRSGRDLLVAPVDVPLVRGATFRALVARWRTLGSPGLGWLAPRHGGRHGHPVLLGRELVEHLLAAPPDRPLRELRPLAAPLAGLEVDDPSVLDDLDTPLDLRRLRDRLRESSSPSSPPEPRDDTSPDS